MSSATDPIQDLRRLLGPENVLTRPASLLAYSYDAALDKNLPAAVFIPRTAEEAAAVVRAAHLRKIPFVARGAGTNLCGASIPAAGGWVLHLGRMNRILEIDPRRRQAWVEPGVVNLHLQRALAPHGLFYAPDPASQKACTLGGNVGTNAGGPHCLKHGVTTHHVSALEVVLPDGGLLKTDVEDPGFDLTGLFVGSEGTLGVATKIRLELLPLPEDVQTLLVPFPSLEAAVQTVTDIVSAGIVPTTLEVMDRITVEAVEAFAHAGYPRDAEAVLLIETDGPRSRTEKEAEKIRALCRQNGCGEIRQARDEKEREKLWEGRRGSYPAMARLAPNVLVEDGVVPRTRLPEAVRRVRAIAEKAGLRMGLIAHAGDGNLHPNMIFDERDPEETRRVKAAGHEMLKVFVDLGGSISGEHGIGTDKRQAMAWLFTPATLGVFRRIKEAFDPENLCNPDKLIPSPASTPKGSPVGDQAGDGIIPVADPPLARPRASRPLPDAGEVSVEDLSQLQDLLGEAGLAGRPVFFKGLGTKGLSTPPGALVVVLRPLRKIVDHDRDNFTLTVGAGATLRELSDFLKPFGQSLHMGGEGTLGGILSTRACRAPRLRDQVLGLKAVLSDGQVVEFGAKVMKNVAGYDAVKLFLGAWGALGAVAEVTLRLWPFPAEEVRLDDPRPDLSWLAAPVPQKIKRAFDPAGVLGRTK